MSADAAVRIAADVPFRAWIFTEDEAAFADCGHVIMDRTEDKP